MRGLLGGTALGQHREGSQESQPVAPLPCPRTTHSARRAIVRAMTFHPALTAVDVRSTDTPGRWDVEMSDGTWHEDLTTEQVRCLTESECHPGWHDNDGPVRAACFG